MLLEILPVPGPKKIEKRKSNTQYGEVKFSKYRIISVLNCWMLNFIIAESPSAKFSSNKLFVIVFAANEWNWLSVPMVWRI